MTKPDDFENRIKQLKKDLDTCLNEEPYQSLSYEKKIDFARLKGQLGAAYMEYYTYLNEQGYTRLAAEMFLCASQLRAQGASDLGREWIDKPDERIITQELTENLSEKELIFLSRCYYYGLNNKPKNLKYSAQLMQVVADKFNSTEAFRRLGQYYFNGRGVKQDYKLALDNLKLAAEGGSVDSHLLLGKIYLKGLGDVNPSLKKALYWFESAANEGCPVTQFELALTVLKDKNGIDSERKSAHWMELAAEHGRKDFQTAMGLKYLEGEGVEKSLASARMWFRKAADQGDKWGLYYYADLMRKGHRDDYAIKYYVKAYEKGCKKARSRLAEIEDVRAQFLIHYCKKNFEAMVDLMMSDIKVYNWFFDYGINSIIDVGTRLKIFAEAINCLENRPMGEKGVKAFLLSLSLKFDARINPNHGAVMEEKLVFYQLINALVGRVFGKDQLLCDLKLSPDEEEIFLIMAGMDKNFSAVAFNTLYKNKFIIQKSEVDEYRQVLNRLTKVLNSETKSPVALRFSEYLSEHAVVHDYPKALINLFDGVCEQAKIALEESKSNSLFKIKLDSMKTLLNTLSTGSLQDTNDYLIAHPSTSTPKATYKK